MSEQHGKPTPSPRIGLFFCECGPNMGNAIRLDDLAAQEAWPEAAVVQRHAFLCAPDGKAKLAEQVRTQGLDRVVIGGCSPHEHEATFRQVLADAGLNPFLLQMTNLREQCEWQGDDDGQATVRARGLVRGALWRAAQQEAVETRTVEASADVVVIGGGMAGLSAALTLAQKNRRVALVERSAALGGLLARLDEVFPSMKCASCFLEPAINQVLDHPQIDVLRESRVVSVKGFHGQFTVEVESAAPAVDPSRCMGAGECAAACPVSFPDPLDEGVGQRKAIGMAYSGSLPHVSHVDPVHCGRCNGAGCDGPCVQACPMNAIDFQRAPVNRTLTCGAVVVATGMETLPVPAVPGVISCVQLERMLHPQGPTSGKVTVPGGGVPRRVVLAPSSEMPARDTDLARRELTKLAVRLLDVCEGVELQLAGDCHQATLAAPMIEQLRAAGVAFSSGALDPATLVPTDNGVSYRRAGKLASTGTADLVVLWTGTRPSSTVGELARDLHVRTTAEGFLEADVDLLVPTGTRVPGIYVVGAALGPRPLGDVVRDGTAAAGRILSTRLPGERLELEPLAARVIPERCGACGVCVTACPYGAIRTLADGKCRVEPAHCRGCGTCAAACPSLAIACPQFEYRQVSAEISGLLAMEGTTRSH
ncbi:MAG: CoB--CoM heterodisulfide reductase iron-sulfur subunit A family protein [Deltaproteobacteria bacterium]|nr:CoB--CoM heterodisulfide reductase iron-sulfur subunit A family protein [Deltaproteobacteria bacterium]